jgi:hypothetical protein
MKTTKQHFDTFKRYVSYWQNVLGLQDWHIYPHVKKLDGSYAETSYTVSQRVATIEFTTTWDAYRELNDHELKMIALHECLHLVTAPLLVEADSRYSTKLDVDSAEHAIVVRLTNFITEHCDA